MKTSENINEISKALAAAQGEMTPASKSSDNPFFKSKYADLNSIWESIREPLRKNEIAVIQDVITTESGISVSTRLCHSSGQWFEFGPFQVALVKKDPQSHGSAATYGKRYSLAAAVGVVSEVDDDGEKAMQGYDREKKQDRKPEKQVKNEDKNPDIISAEQAEELENILVDCNPDYVRDIWNALRQLKSPITDVNNLPLKMFNKFKIGAINNRDEYQKNNGAA